MCSFGGFIGWLVTEVVQQYLSKLFFEKNTFVKKRNDNIDNGELTFLALSRGITRITGW